MPKSETESKAKTVTKSTTKTTSKKPKTTPENDLISPSVESYVPKITHWTKNKKTRADMPENTNSESPKNVTENPNESILSQNLNQNPPPNPKIFTKIDPEPIQIKSEEKIQIDKLTNNTTLEKSLINAHIPSKSTLPSFLNRTSVLKKSVPTPASLTNQIPNPKLDSDNSLTSIFKRDQDEVSNIKRVFRKSIVFLTLALLTFGLSSLASGNFSIQSAFTLAFTGLGFVAITNIFFIIVAHRAYIWLFLVGQFVILSITQYPYSVNLSTLIIGFVSILLTYLAYLDLEKIQLGSRLFSIPYIVGESTKILSSVLIFIVCLSSFNQMSAKGLDKFLGESVLTVPVVMDKAALPFYQNVVARGSNLNIIQNGATVESLICAEQNLVCGTKNNTILAQEEYSKLNKECETKTLTNENCLTLKASAEKAILNKYLAKDLPGFSLTLDTKLDSESYRPALNQLIQNRVKTFIEPSKFGFLPKFISAQSLIPFIVSLLLFILLSIFKFMIVWLGFIVTWIVWKLLQITGFVHLDVEMVEAEIVGI